MQGKRARAKPEQSKATTVRSSQASLTCFHASAVTLGDTPGHTPQRTPPVRQQTASPASGAHPKQGDRLPVTAAQPAAAPEQQPQGVVDVCAPGGNNTARKQQQLMSPVASLPWIQNAQTAAALPDQAPLHLLAGERRPSQSRHADNSPEVGQGHIAGCESAMLGSPAGPGWQGPPADTPPTPLSSHPIDALEGSEAASASTSATDAASDPLFAHSDERSNRVRSSECETPFSPEFGNMVGPSLDGHLPTQDLDHGSSCWLHTDAQPQHGSLKRGKGRHCPQGGSLPLEADAVMLEMESDISVSADGLMSPASSAKLWQSHIAAHSPASSPRSPASSPRSPASSPRSPASSQHLPASSSHSNKLLPTMSHDTALSLDNHQQHLHLLTTDAILERADPVDSRADGIPGLYHASAPMSDSSPLPGPWHYPYQPHHHPCKQQGSAPSVTSPSSTSWQQQSELQGTNDSAGQSSRHRTPFVTADYAAAAAQLRQAVAQAEQLYQVSNQTTSQQCGVWSNSMDAVGQAGAACSDTSGQEQDAVGGCSQQLPSALPLSRRLGVQHAMRRGAEPSYPMQQPVWVPQGITSAPPLHKSAFHVFCASCA